MAHRTTPLRRRMIEDMKIGDMSVLTEAASSRAVHFRSPLPYCKKMRIFACPPGRALLTS